MTQTSPFTRRSLLKSAAAGAVGTGLALAAPVGQAVAAPPPAAPLPPTGRAPLWKQAIRNGIAFGSSTATWQLDRRYSMLHAREAAVLFTEDDLLWYQLKPGPDAPLNFATGDQIVSFAEGNQQLTIGAHLAWDEGFGEGWKDKDLWGLSRADAEDLLYGVITAEVSRYAGRMSGWIVANEVTDPVDANKHGFRKNVPWFSTIGPSYIAESFHLAEQNDPDALRIINEFGFETVNEYGDRPGPRRRAYLKAIDRLLDKGVPVQAAGIQGHLLADGFGQKFDERGYRQFLHELADRDLTILITELDVLDQGLPKNVVERDRAVADVYRRYLDVTLDERAVKVVIAFGLSDRYTWLDEDQPRADGAHRRPLPFDRRLRPKRAYDALSRSLRQAPSRSPLWTLAKVQN